MMSRIATYMVTRSYCIRYKVKWDDEMKAMAAMSGEELKQMEEWAPYAAPLIGEWIQKYGKYIGAGIYLCMLSAGLADRIDIVKQKAPQKVKDDLEKKRDEMKAARPEPTVRESVQGMRGAVNEDKAMADLWKAAAGGKMPTIAAEAKAS